MATQGPLYPNSANCINDAADNGTGENDDAWVNPGNVAGEGSSEATIVAASFDTPDISRRLRTQNYGFSIPAGSTINGVVAEIRRRGITAPGAGSDNRVQLCNGADPNVIGDNKADTALDWPLALTVKTYGGAADGWNASLTPEIVNGANFGLVLSTQADEANSDIGVEYIRLTVHYTPPADNRIEVSWAELEVPTPSNRVEVSWAELEVPTPNNRIELSWAEFEVPSLGPEDNRVEVSWAELEVPSPNNRVELSWAEFEVPTPDNRLELAWAEFEVPTPGNRIELAWAELEVPDVGAAPTYAQLTVTAMYENLPDIPWSGSWAGQIWSDLGSSPVELTIPAGQQALLSGTVTVTRKALDNDTARGWLLLEILVDDEVVGRAYFFTTGPGGFEVFEEGIADNEITRTITFSDIIFSGERTITISARMATSNFVPTFVFDLDVLASLTAG